MRELTFPANPHQYDQRTVNRVIVVRNLGDKPGTYGSALNHSAAIELQVGNGRALMTLGQARKLAEGIRQLAQTAIT